MKLQIHPTLIFRTPKFPYTAELSECWEDLKSAIKVSSEAFYQNIKDVEAGDLDKLPQKIQYTIWKYFNRAKYRSTPYGTFASFSILSTIDNLSNNPIIIDEEQKLHEFIDWPVKNELNFAFEELINIDGKIISNNSYYLVGGNIRYIGCTDGQFELAEIEYDEFVYKILNSCLIPISVSEILTKLALNNQEEIEFFYGLLNDMHSLQLLFSEKDPNIIGDDYFKRIDYNLNQEAPKYIIAERKPIFGCLDFSIFSALPNLMQLLQELSSENEQNALKNFINRFVQKFEQREIPLVQALDPEIGVGYDELEQAEQSDDFVSQFKKQTNNSSINKLDNFKKELKRKIFKDDIQRDQPVFLDKISLNLESKKSVLPNSLSLMISVVDDLFHIEQLGGVTANALSGRFTIASDDVYNYTQEIATIEKNANPNVLFFDVAYMVETGVDNINRRKLIYDYELAILNFDTSEHPLTLNDILISVQNNEVVLRSNKHNKRLIPRIASAYNYARSDLSVFRLFCDLQHQGIQSNLSISLENLFPDQSFYPRFQYKNIILAQAKWRIYSKDFFKDLGQDPSFESCRDYLVKLGINKFFKTGRADQTLTFCVDNELDMLFFLQYMQKQIFCYLEEVIFPNISAVQDQFNKPYSAQFILGLTHQEEIYKGIEKIQEKAVTDVKQFFAPGSEWLYFEIFCHQQRSDHLLLTSIQSFLNQYKSKIKSWFFIRYNENGNHIRLRLLLKDEISGQELMAGLSIILDQELGSGLVSDILIKTYKRENDRYGSDLIEDVEQHFFVDSEYVLALLGYNFRPNQKYKLCIALVFEIQKSLFKPESFKQVVQMISDSFNREHKLEAGDFKKLNTQYQLYKTDEVPVLDKELQNYFTAFSNSFIEILKKCSIERRAKLFGDLLHMHVNRLFNKDQRTNEMVIYYFLSKDIQRKIATSKELSN